MEHYRAYGDASDRVVDLCDGVDITSYANPAVPVTTTFDWIAAGYADGDPLDSKAGALPSLTWTAVDESNQAVSIWQGGVSKPAIKLPFMIVGAAPTVPLFIYNVPRFSVIYSVVVTFTKPNGEDTIVTKWQVSVS